MKYMKVVLIIEDVLCDNDLEQELIKVLDKNHIKYCSDNRIIAREYELV
jgi:hypothetical protein